MNDYVIISLSAFFLLNFHGHSIHLLMLHLVAEIEHVAVIEGHVVAITAEDNKMILEDHASVTVPGSWPLSLDVEDLGLIRTAHHRRAVRVS